MLLASLGPAKWLSLKGEPPRWSLPLMLRLGCDTGFGQRSVASGEPHAL
jgi:hypothetical protein